MFLAILRYLQSLGFVSVMETSVFQKAKAKAKKVKDTIRTKTGHGPGVDNTNQNDQGHDKEDEQMVEPSEVHDTGPSMTLSTSYIILYISGLYDWFIVIPLCFETEKLIFFLNKVILEILVYVFPCYFHLLISDE